MIFLDFFACFQTFRVDIFSRIRPKIREKLSSIYFISLRHISRHILELILRWLQLLHWFIRLNCWLDSIAVLSSGGWCSWVLRRHQHWKVSKKCPTSTTIIPDRFVEYVHPNWWRAPSHKQQYRRLALWVPIKCFIMSSNVLEVFRSASKGGEYYTGTNLGKIKEDDIHHRLKDPDMQIVMSTSFESWMINPNRQRIDYV